MGENKKIDSNLQIDNFISKNEIIEEMNSDDIPLLTIPFVNAYNFNSFEMYLNFVEDIENLGFLEDHLKIGIDFKELKNKKTENKEFLSFIEITREKKLSHFSFKSSFKSLPINFTKEYNKAILTYLYILAIENINFIQFKIGKESSSRREEPTKKHKIKFVEVPKNSRIDFFKNRNKPTMTLDEFADKIEKEIEEREENMNKIVNFNNLYELKEDTLVELRKKDEFNDDKIDGNTYNRG